MKELRNEARETLKHLFAYVEHDDRSVTVYSGGYHCNSWNRFDPEFITDDINVAIDYLYPQ